MNDPAKAADEFISFVPEWKGKERGVHFAFEMYAKSVYPGQRVIGEMDRDRISRLQEFYVSKNLIQKAAPVDDLFTNEFIGPG